MLPKLKPLLRSKKRRRWRKRLESPLREPMHSYAIVTMLKPKQLLHSRCKLRPTPYRNSKRSALHLLRPQLPINRRTRSVIIDANSLKHVSKRWRRKSKLELGLGRCKHNLPELYVREQCLRFPKSLQGSRIRQLWHG